MKITALEEYGLRCLIQIARASGNGISISEISRKEGLSVQYVSKITSILRKSGLVESTRGLKGGYRLVKKPGELNLAEISHVLGGMMFDADFCEAHTGKKRVCVHEEDCSVRSLWGIVYKYMTTILENLTLEDLFLSEENTKSKLMQVILDREKQLERENTLRLVGGSTTQGKNG